MQSSLKLSLQNTVLTKLITMTAKLVLYINICFCAPLIPFEVSLSKNSSLSKSYVCIFSVQPNSLLYYNQFSCLQSTYVCSIPRNLLWTDRQCWKCWSHCIIYTACTCASKHDPFLSHWTSQSMGQAKLYAKTIHVTQVSTEQHRELYKLLTSQLEREVVTGEKEQTETQHPD